MSVAFVALAFAAALCAADLVSWHRRTGYRRDQWTNDGKNVGVMIEAAVDPLKYRRDFPFGRLPSRNFYLPLFLRLLGLLARRRGSLESAVGASHAWMTTVFVAGWVLWAAAATGSPAAAFFALFLAVPYVTIVASDGIASGLPGHWTPRFWANALAPLFFALLIPLDRGAAALLPAAVLTGLLFVLHPSTGIGTTLILFLAAAFLALRIGGAGIVAASAGGVAALLCLPSAFSFLRATGEARAAALSPADRRRFLDLAMERTSAWPYVSDPPFASVAVKRVYGPYLPRLGRRLPQVVIGTAYLILSAFLFVDPGGWGEGRVFTWQAAANLSILLLLLERGHSSRLLLLLLAFLRVLHPPGSPFLPVLSALVIGALAAAARTPPYPFFRVFLIALAGLGLAAVAQGRPPAGPEPLPAHHWILLWAVPILHAAYLSGCVLFHWVWPVLLGRGFPFVDWPRIAKVMLYPAHLYAFEAIAGLVAAAGSGRIADALPACAALLLIPTWHFHFRRRFESAPDLRADGPLFAWAEKNLPVDALVHVVSDRPPHHQPGSPSTSTLPFHFRALAHRSITGSWKDGGVTSYVSPSLFAEWYRRMEANARRIAARDAAGIVADARSYGADHVVLPSDLLPADGLPGARLLRRNEAHAVLRLEADGQSR